MIVPILRTIHFDDNAKALEDWLAANPGSTDEPSAGADSPSPRGWPTFTFSCKGGNDEASGNGWKIGTQAAIVLTFAKPAKVASRRVTSQRQVPSTPQIIAFAMICCGRDDRVVGRVGASSVALNRPSWASRLWKVNVPTLTSQNQSKVGIGPFLRR